MLEHRNRDEDDPKWRPVVHDGHRRRMRRVCPAYQARHRCPLQRGGLRSSMWFVAIVHRQTNAATTPPATATRMTQLDRRIDGRISTVQYRRGSTSRLHAWCRAGPMIRTEPSRCDTAAIDSPPSSTTPRSILRLPAALARYHASDRRTRRPSSRCAFPGASSLPLGAARDPSSP